MKRLLMLACVMVPVLSLAADKEPLILRVYPVTPSLLSRAVAPPAAKTGSGGKEFVEMSVDDLSRNLGRTKTDEDDKQLRKWLENCGVTFPSDSYVRYMGAFTRIFFYNTEANHVLVKRLLDTIDTASHQVAMDVTWISMPAPEIEALARKDASARVEPASVFALWQSGKGNLLYAERIITKSGVNVTHQSVEEEIYPTEVFTSVTDSGQVDRASTVLPGSLETRETGFIFNATPTADPSGRIIDVTIAPEVAMLLGYKDDASPKPGPSVPLPQFHSRNITTSVVLESGKPLLMGGLPAPDGKSLTYLILTATLVNARGEPIEDPWKDLAAPP